MKLENARNYMITDMEFSWAKLDQASTSSGVTKEGRSFTTPLQWEITISTTDADKAAELVANRIPLKEKDGVFSIAMRRNALKKDGSSMDPVRFVGRDKLPLASRNSIGNGSRGNVIVWQAPYGTNDVFNSLTAVQVIDHVEYNGGDGTDFDVIPEDPDSAMF